MTSMAKAAIAKARNERGQRKAVELAMDAKRTFREVNGFFGSMQLDFDSYLFGFWEHAASKDSSGDLRGNRSLFINTANGGAQ